VAADDLFGVMPFAHPRASRSTPPRRRQDGPQGTGAMPRGGPRQRPAGPDLSAEGVSSTRCGRPTAPRWQRPNAAASDAEHW